MLEGVCFVISMCEEEEVSKLFSIGITVWCFEISIVDCEHHFASSLYIPRFRSIVPSTTKTCLSRVCTSFTLLLYDPYGVMLLSLLFGHDIFLFSRYLFCCSIALSPSYLASLGAAA